MNDGGIEAIVRTSPPLPMTHRPTPLPLDKMLTLELRHFARPQVR